MSDRQGQRCTQWHLLETGREVFVGSLNGRPVGVFETTYKFESKSEPDVSIGLESAAGASTRSSPAAGPVGSPASPDGSTSRTSSRTGKANRTVDTSVFRERTCRRQGSLVVSQLQHRLEDENAGSRGVATTRRRSSGVQAWPEVAEASSWG